MILQSHFWAYIWRKPYSKRYIHPSVHCSSIYNRQDLKPTKCPRPFLWKERDSLFTTEQWSHSPVLLLSFYSYPSPRPTFFPQDTPRLGLLPKTALTLKRNRLLPTHIHLSKIVFTQSWHALHMEYHKQVNRFVNLLFSVNTIPNSNMSSLKHIHKFFFSCFSIQGMH